MISKFAAATALLASSFVYAQSTIDATHMHSIGTNRLKPTVQEQCGISLRTPALKSVSDQMIGFGCTKSYEKDGYAVMDMNFQYDPNFNARGQDHITFVIEEIGIDKKIRGEMGESIFRMSPGETQPKLVPELAYQESNCGNPVIKVQVTSIQGSNWRGWIAEETFGKHRGSCTPAKEYTSGYRCVHLMIGNEKMMAQLDGVCLLRNREFSLENGFSYDLFMDMLKTLSFNEG